MMGRPRMMSANQATQEQSLRGRFRSYVRQDAYRQKRRLRTRAIAAAGTGIAAGLAVHYGGPRALQLLESAQKGAIDISKKSGGQMMRRNAPFVQRFFKQRSKEEPVEKLAMGGIGIVSSELGKKAVRALHTHPFRTAGAVGAAHLGLGTAHDVRRTRREQGRFARRLLLL